MEYLDPDLVKMQFQMSSMRTVGDPIMYFMNHPGPLRLGAPAGRGHDPGDVPSRARLPGGQADARGGRGGGRGQGPRRRVAAAEAAAAMRSRSARTRVDWPKVFTAAKTGGLKNYFVEQGWDITVKSVAFLKTLSTT